MSGERQVSFTWDHLQGQVLLGGHDVSNLVRAVTLGATVNDPAVVTLELVPRGGRIEGPARVVVDEPLHGLLVELGWTPPAWLELRRHMNGRR